MQTLNVSSHYLEAISHPRHCYSLQRQGNYQLNALILGSKWKPQVLFMSLDKPTEKNSSFSRALISDISIYYFDKWDFIFALTTILLLASVVHSCRSGSSFTHIERKWVFNYYICPINFLVGCICPFYAFKTFCSITAVLPPFQWFNPITWLSWIVLYFWGWGYASLHGVQCCFIKNLILGDVKCLYIWVINIIKQPMAMEQVLSDRDSEDEVDDDVADLEDRRVCCLPDQYWFSISSAQNLYP